MVGILGRAPRKNGWQSRLSKMGHGNNQNVYANNKAVHSVWFLWVEEGSRLAARSSGTTENLRVGCPKRQCAYPWLTARYIGPAQVLFPVFGRFLIGIFFQFLPLFFKVFSFLFYSVFLYLFSFYVSKFMNIF